MNRSYRILPIYTADVSGVCSALYELGGMVVMHDPSGCNSTYNTHDELRWYDHDSLIFISGLAEMDAIMGNDQKLVDDIVSAARSLHPNFIALASAPIPYMNGTDFDGISREIESLSGIPTFFVKTNGMHDYVIGVGNALAEIASRFLIQPQRKRPHSVNLLGVTPLDFGRQTSADTLRKQLTEAGWEVLSCWSMGDSLDILRRSSEAAVNLVVSAVGLSAAKIMEKKYGIPYVVGCPVGDDNRLLFRALAEAENSGLSSIFSPIFDTTDKEMVTLIGEPVTMRGLAYAIEEKYGISTQLLCPLEGCEALLRPGDCAVKGEEEMEQALHNAKIIVADPLYRPICPADAVFYPLPHIAFSGRCFQRQYINLFDIKL